MSIQQPDLRKRYRTWNLPEGKAEVWLEEAGNQVIMKTIRPNGGGGSNWKRCDVVGCLGEAVTSENKCLQHSSWPAINSYIQYVQTLGERSVLSFKGVLVSQALLNLILGPGILENVMVIDFSGADIDAQLSLKNVALNFFMLHGAIIRQYFRFEQCEFKNQLFADFAFFNAGPPSFSNTIFQSGVGLSYASAERVSIWFSDCTFNQTFTADGICGSLGLERCGFKRNLQIRNAQAEGLMFNDNVVDGTIDVENTKCSFFRAQNLRASNAYQFGPISSQNDIALNNAQFSTNTALKVQSNLLDITGVQFSKGGQIFADASKINLKQVVTGGPLLIAGENPEKKPRIISLQGADTGQMTFSNVDMSGCIFYGSRDLNKIALEPTVKFAFSPGKLGTKRRCIADEFVWRANSKKWFAKIWKISWEQIINQFKDENNPENNTAVPQLQASQVAGVYRELRHSFEVKKDLMNASDFYYGEMEMRRQNKETNLAEKFIITLYWIISGYGLYATRALLCLLTTVILGAVLLFHFGFTNPHTFMESLIFSFRSAIPGLQPQGTLTILGEWIEITLSIAGPVLATLAALAIRERVKR
jgi:hypothetical protein